MAHAFKIGDTVLFGRGQGEQTLGEVVKVNAKSLKVKTLEPRGRTRRGQSAGLIWRVPPSLCTPTTPSADPEARPCGEPKDALPALVARALRKLTAEEAEALREHFNSW